MEYHGGSDRRDDEDHLHEETPGTALEMNDDAVFILCSCDGEATATLRKLHGLWGKRLASARHENAFLSPQGHGAAAP